jgi:hypothetical protein
MLKLRNFVNGRGWSSLLKRSQFEAAFKPSSMRPLIKTSLKFLWDYFQQGVERIKLFRMNSPGDRKTALFVYFKACLLQVISVSILITKITFC